MASFDVKIDDKAFLTIVPSLSTSWADYDSLAGGKAMARVVGVSHTLPPLLTKRVKTHVKLRENGCCCCIYSTCSVLLCFLPNACYDQNIWNQDRDPDLVKQEVIKILHAEGIDQEAYRIVDYAGSTDHFSDGRIVLKVHFRKEGQTEL